MKVKELIEKNADWNENSSLFVSVNTLGTKPYTIKEIYTKYGNSDVRYFSKDLLILE